MQNPANLDIDRIGEHGVGAISSTYAPQLDQFYEAVV